MFYRDKRKSGKVSLLRGQYQRKDSTMMNWIDRRITSGTRRTMMA
jgi:hypothetical protein